MTRLVDDAGIGFIKTWEGFRLSAYQDQAGIWTIGYGHTRGVYPGMAITPAQADQCLREDLLTAESAVDAGTATVSTTNQQFDAMTSLCFNIGQANFRSSSVLKFHLTANYQQAADAFLLWDKITVNGALIVSQGLLNRRTAERQLYLSAGGDIFGDT